MKHCYLKKFNNKSLAFFSFLLTTIFLLFCNELIQNINQKNKALSGKDDWVSVCSDYHQNPAVLCGNALLELGDELLQNGSDNYYDDSDNWLYKPGIRPGKDLLDKELESDHFLIHFSVKSEYRPGGSNASVDDIRQWLLSLQQYLEEAYQLLIREKGYALPPLDGRKGGHQNLIDVYVLPLQNAGGITHNDSELPANQSQASSYILIKNTLTRTHQPSSYPVNRLQATAQHEFFHVIQDGYYASQLAALNTGKAMSSLSASFREGTAVWAETLNSEHSSTRMTTNKSNQRYLEYLNWSPNIFSAPQKNMLVYDENQAFNLFAYSSVFFWKYLSEQFGDGVIKTLWEMKMQKQGPSGDVDKEFKDLEQVLEKNGGPAKVYGDFLTACALLNHNTKNKPYAFYQKSYPAYTFREGQDYIKECMGIDDNGLVVPSSITRFLSPKHEPIQVSKGNLTSWYYMNVSTQKWGTGRLLETESVLCDLQPAGGAGFHYIQINEIADLGNKPDNDLYQIHIKAPKGHLHSIKKSDLYGRLLCFQKDGSLLEKTATYISTQQESIIKFNHQAGNQYILIVYRLTSPNIARHAGTGTLRYQIDVY